MDKLSQMPDLIVFDVDGTLLNTIGDLQVSMNEILARHGFPVLSREEVRRLIGNGAREFMRLALPESARSVERVESMLAEYAASADLALTDPEAAAPLAAEAGLTADPEAALAAIPDCGLTFLTGADMRGAVQSFFEVLAGQDPAAIGGSIPDDAFYYIP